jgi:hypothetical protein
LLGRTALDCWPTSSTSHGRKGATANLMDAVFAKLKAEDLNEE